MMFGLIFLAFIVCDALRGIPSLRRHLLVSRRLDTCHLREDINKVGLRLVADTLSDGAYRVVAVALLVVHACHGLLHTVGVEEGTEVLLIHVVDDLRDIARVGTDHRRQLLDAEVTVAISLSGLHHLKDGILAAVP